MRHPRLLILAVVLGLCLTSASCALKRVDMATAPVRHIPTEDFFRNPEQTAFSLSPGGEYVACKKPWQDRLNIFVRNVDTGEEVRVTNATARDIDNYAWVTDQRLVYTGDTGGDENFRVYAVNADGSDLKELTPFSGVRVQLLDKLEHDPNAILITMNQRDPKLFDVYRIDINTGELTLVAENPGNVTGWMADNQGRVRLAIASNGVEATLLYRATEEEEFAAVRTSDFKDSLQPLFFDFDDKYLYVASNIDRDKKAVYRYDPATDTFLDLIYENDQVDVNHLMRSKSRQVITGASFFTDKPQYDFFDPERKALQERLEALLPEGVVGVSDASLDESRLLVVNFSDRSMFTYYCYDQTTETLTLLADAAPWINEEEMAEMRPITFTARDGLVIHGYLTLPRGMEAEDLPVVVVPHGGPSARDRWGFDPTVQFLANRGMAVLQINFRGSTGYGKEFWAAGFKEWGGNMQNDITDGVLWLVDQGIADPERVGIYGASYGGYAALAGLTFTPDLFACGVSYVGPSNLITLLESIPPYWEPVKEMLYEQVGDPVKDKKKLEANSPVFHAENIKSPLMVAQGANDPRVKKSESDQIVDALRKRGVDVEYMVKDNEGHGFRNVENRLEFHRAVEKFLLKHLVHGLSNNSTEPVTDGGV